MDDSILQIRGRQFTEEDIALIISLVYEHFDKGRTYISQEVCKELDWRQPNGWLKDRACRDVLRYLEKQDFFDLPKPIVRVNKKSAKKIPKTDNLLSAYDLQTPLEIFPSKIDLIFSKGNSYEPIWNALVQEYHYLGYRISVGRTIKYLIVADDRLIGAIAYSSPAWQIAPRDMLLNKMGIYAPHDFTINNSRFLLLPHVNVKNLASKILSLSTKKVQNDWSNYYSIEPLLAETFVSPSRFNGTCYRAANWVNVGITKGYTKRGPAHRNSQEPKIIFLYGLNKRIRKSLRNMT